jgi:hypothetical protein
MREHCIIITEKSRMAWERGNKTKQNKTNSKTTSPHFLLRRNVDTGKGLAFS